ncbi:DUF4131 domain-containing protein [Nocardioides daphniae]|nr:DUF4131 domain-containing protein [Nocardioides daphniae]QCC78470.1 DUF4131 domain-containing protein [Nocardioides daphniae]
MPYAAPRPRRGAHPREWSRAVLTLLLTALLAGGGILATATPAQACTCQTSDLRKLTKQADVVYTGVVQSSSTTDEGQRQFQVVAQRLFKGDLASARVTVTDAIGAGCGIGEPEEGERWLFLTTTANATGLCSGTRPLKQRDLVKVQRSLGVGERLPAPDPAKAVRTKVEGAAPVDFARLAAPGAAAILLGLLGLAVVGRLNRH